MRSLCSRALYAPATLALLGAIACSDGTTAPPAAGAPELRGQMFQLMIDGRTGHVTVAEPSAATSSGAGGSFSLLGRDAIQVGAGDCVFSPIANNTKQKRCTLGLSITNRLQITDLVTPTTFPRPPQGTTGILVFPFTAAALGVTGGSAVPNGDWDNAPANLFNDFGVCPGSATSDCYRWERFASPLYAGATSETRTVGFNLDKAAQNVTAYIVVAADLRDNPLQTVTIAPEPGNCGTVRNGATAGTSIDPAQLDVFYDKRAPEVFRTFCSFPLGALPADAAIITATLTFKQIVVSGPPEILGPVIVDHLDYGTLDDDDFDLAPLSGNIGTFPMSGQEVVRTLAVPDQVSADLQAARTRSQYRLRLTTESGDDNGGVAYLGPTGDGAPSLEIVYRHR